MSGPLLLFHYGTFHWFHRDEWAFLTESAAGGGEWLRYTHDAFSGAHWVAVPRVIYQGLWHLVGMTTYLPYQLVVVVLHVLLATGLHLIIRRAGVRPWLAMAAAGIFVLGGPGASTTLWAFQMTIVGSMTFGVAHLMLADHDGGADRRDALGLACGILAITFSGVGVTTTVAVVVATVLRRGWRMAALHGGPLAIVYATWSVLAGAETTSDSGRPSALGVLRWTGEMWLGALEAIGRWRITSIAIMAVVLTGAMLIWRGRSARQNREQLARRLSVPLGLAVAAAFFGASTALGRAAGGLALARSDRYVYLVAAMLLPLIAVGAEAVADRWARSTSLLVLLLVVQIPFNLATFDSRTPEGRIFGEAHHSDRRFVLTTAVRMPFADDVPRDVEPAPDPAAYGVTIGFLLDSVASGRLHPSTDPLTPRVVNELRVRLGLSREPYRSVGGPCRRVAEGLDVDLARGEQLHFGSDVVIQTEEGGRPTSRRVGFARDGAGFTLTAELPDLSLRLQPPLGASTFTLCGR